MTLRKQLPAGVMPEQVRAAMTAVIRRMIEAPGTFDQHGWLTIGFCGHQPDVAEPYISTGSLYLCSVGLLPLGLGKSDRFWSAAPQPWTAQKIWSGQEHRSGSRHMKTDVGALDTPKQLAQDGHGVAAKQ